MATYARINDYPGMASITEGLGYFEQAYDAGDNLVARVRFKPVQVDAPESSQTIEGPVVPTSLAVKCSSSLVDASGQVIKIAGRYLVRDPAGESWQFDSGDTLDAEVWKDEMAARSIDELLRARTALLAAEMFIVPAT